MSFEIEVLTLSIRLSKTPSRQEIALLWSETDFNLALNVNVSEFNFHKLLEFKERRSKLTSLAMIALRLSAEIPGFWLIDNHWIAFKSATLKNYTQ